MWLLFHTRFSAFLGWVDDLRENVNALVAHKSLCWRRLVCVKIWKLVLFVSLGAWVSEPVRTRPELANALLLCEVFCSVFCGVFFMLSCPVLCCCDVFVLSCVVFLSCLVVCAFVCLNLCCFLSCFLCPVLCNIVFCLFFLFCFFVLSCLVLFFVLSCLVLGCCVCLLFFL